MLIIFAAMGWGNRFVGKRAKVRPRQPAKGMNKTEARYAAKLKADLLAGRIAQFEFEAVTLKLSDALRFTPDFMVIDADMHVTFYDTKAGKKDGTVLVEDDALAKLKMAAERFPHFGFVMTWEDKTTGLWREREFRHL